MRTKNKKRIKQNENVKSPFATHSRPNKTLKTDKNSKHAKLHTVPEEKLPVDKGHAVHFQVEHESTWRALVEGKCLEYLAVVSKLGQHHLPSVDQQRTGSVAVILDAQTHGETDVERDM